MVTVCAVDHQEHNVFFVVRSDWRTPPETYQQVSSWPNLPQSSKPLIFRRHISPFDLDQTLEGGNELVKAQSCAGDVVRFCTNLPGEISKIQICG